MVAVRDKLDSYAMSNRFGFAAAILAVGLLSQAQADEYWGPLELLGRQIEPGSNTRFSFIPDQSFDASYLDMPVFVARALARRCA